GRGEPGATTAHRPGISNSRLSGVPPSRERFGSRLRERAIFQLVQNLDLDYFQVHQFLAVVEDGDLSRSRQAVKLLVIAEYFLLRGLLARKNVDRPHLGFH